jgi:ATP-binding cassette, subfamily C (CFTR/MRP), member 1
MMEMIVNNLIEIENQFNSVERLTEYGKKIPNEKARVIANNRPPKYWPEKGKVEFISFSMKYSKDKPEVLHKLNFTINPGEKIGVCGRFQFFFFFLNLNLNFFFFKFFLKFRTGSGKSSLLVSLFRLVESCKGIIKIDDLNIFDIGLDDLRKNISIIPQG